MAGAEEITRAGLDLMLTSLYSIINPDKLSTIATILHRYEGQPQVLISDLQRKYACNPKAMFIIHQGQVQLGICPRSRLIEVSSAVLEHILITSLPACNLSKLSLTCRYLASTCVARYIQLLQTAFPHRPLPPDELNELDCFHLQRLFHQRLGKSFDTPSAIPVDAWHNSGVASPELAVTSGISLRRRALSWDVATIEAWFRTSVPGIVLSAKEHNVASAQVALIFVSADGKLRGKMPGGSQLTSDEVVTDGQLHHCMLTCSQSCDSFYVDGQLVGSAHRAPSSRFGPAFGQIGAGGFTVDDDGGVFKQWAMEVFPAVDQVAACRMHSTELDAERALEHFRLGPAARLQDVAQAAAVAGSNAFMAAMDITSVVIWSLDAYSESVN